MARRRFEKLRHLVRRRRRILDDIALGIMVLGGILFLFYLIWSPPR